MPEITEINIKKGKQNNERSNNQSARSTGNKKTTEMTDFLFNRIDFL